MIANAGNIGISGFSVLPHVKIADGYLDVILFKSANVPSLISWLKSIIKKNKPQGSIKHWQAKKVSIRFTPLTQIICDDIPITVSSIHVQVKPQSLTIVVP